MKLLITVILFSLFALFETVDAAPIESRQAISNITDKQIDALVGLVRAYGYTCDSVSAAYPFVFGFGYNLTCNHGRYSYELEDKGGNWIVTVD